MVEDSKYKYETCLYPLVERKVTRDDCLKIIENAGYKIPIKSGCFFCPFNNKKVWISLKLEHPDLFQKALDMEKNSDHPHKRENPLILYKGKETQSLFECGCFNG
jgi:hypothetical protein